MFLRGLLAAAALCAAGAANAVEAPTAGIVDSGIRLSVDLRPNGANAPAGTPPGVLVFDSFNPNETLTSTASAPNTFMGYAFNTIDPGGPVQLTGMQIYVVNNTGATLNATNLRANIQFWDNFDAAANPVFGTPIGGTPISVDLGPVVFNTGTYIEVDVTFPAPLPAFTGLANHGFAANWQVDTGTGLQSLNNLTTALRFGPNPIAVGTSPIPGTAYGYRNASARTDFNFLSTDLRGFAATNLNQATVFRLFALQPTVADVSITETDGVATVTAGGSTTYTITASNAGPSAVTGATVADTFPASLTCTWTCVGAGGGTCTASGSGNISDTVNLPAGGSTTYTASCSISAAATGTLVNTATVAAPGGVTDPTAGNNSATDTDTIGASADLAITKTDGVASVTAGGNTIYTITASNAGPSNATGVTVTDSFPPSLACTWTCVGAGGGTCTASGSGNISDTVNLPAGGSTTYTASCSISAAATGTLVNTATVAAPGGVTDPTAGNNSATDTDTINPAPTVSVTGTKSVSGTFSPGGTVLYSIVLTNNGNATQADNAGAELTDVLPAPLVLVAANASSGTAVATVATRTVTWNGAIPAGASVTITISASIPANATGSTISNQGGIATDLDANGTNETTRTTDNPATQTANDPTSFTLVVVTPTGIGGPITPVPTLGAWMLALLALLLGGFAAMHMRRNA